MKRTEITSSPQVLKKSQPEEFDLVILGGGTGSTIAAWTFAGEGKQVAVVERKYIGGSCPNIACLPSKNIIHSAKVASYFRRSKEFGITHDGFAIDMADVRERKRLPAAARKRETARHCRAPRGAADLSRARRRTAHRVENNPCSFTVGKLLYFFFVLASHSSSLLDRSQRDEHALVVAGGN